MNEKLKDYMDRQDEKLRNDLEAYFQLPVFVDEIAEDEYPEKYHFFLIVYGDMTATSPGQMYQDVYVVYVTEKNPDVEKDTVDIVSIGSKIPGFEFQRTKKERFQAKDTDYFIDQVTLVFRRKLKYEC